MTKTKKIEKSEMYIILFFALFGISWMLCVVPYLQSSDYFNALNPIQSYLTYNIGLIFLFTALFGMPISYLINKKINVTAILQAGFSAFIGVSWFIDLYAAPIVWNSNGELLISPTPLNMGATSAEYMFGWIFQQIGFTGPMLYYSIYAGIPILSLIVIAFITNPQKLLNVISKR
jgi:hypothetical protein